MPTPLRGETTKSPQRSAERLNGLAPTFDLPAVVASLKQKESWHRSDLNARTLYKEPGTTIVLTALKAGAALPEHHTDGHVTIQAVAGHMHVHLSGDVVDLPTGHLVVLAPGVKHDAEASTRAPSC